MASLLSHFFDGMREVAAEALGFILESMLAPIEARADGDPEVAASLLTDAHVEVLTRAHDAILEGIVSSLVRAGLGLGYLWLPTLARADGCVVVDVDARTCVCVCVCVCVCACDAWLVVGHRTSSRC